tara:strand:+ start:1162 stop:1662 length:501 start_codon:yes stop_codon:yes gene_type:complete
MANLKKTSERQRILKVHPVGMSKDPTTMPDPDVPDDWVFKGKQWKVKSSDDSKSEWKVPPIWVERKVGEPDIGSREKRKVLMVRYAGSKNFPNNANGQFEIDVPEYFFDSVGNFTARPLYQSTDTLHILWTGTDAIKDSGWIDLNYQERGGNGGGGATEVGCAKWS